MVPAPYVPTAPALSWLVYWEGRFDDGGEDVAQLAAATASVRASPAVAGWRESKPDDVARTTYDKHRRAPPRIAPLPCQSLTPHIGAPMSVDGASPRPAYRLFVGVDIAAATFTAVWMAPGAVPRRPLTLDQAPQGVAALQARLRANGHAPGEILVVMEATGS